MDFLSQKAVILGAGLLGGSLGMALRSRGLAKEVHAWSPSGKTRAACSQADWCDRVHESPQEACQGADLVFLCAPVDTIPFLMESIAPYCGRECLVTDVGSTKAKICKAGILHFAPEHPATFVGSHPMAGSEKSGLAYAESGLFEGKTCLLTPVDTSPGPLVRLRGLWTGLGMRLFECTPEEHDRIVAHVSHLPHAMAAVLCAGLADLPPQWSQCAGAGLKDTSRIAAGDPNLWAAIFRENETAFRESLDRLEASLAEMRKCLDEPGETRLLSFLEKARDYRLHLDREHA